MKTWKALLYASSISILLVGLRITISWSYTSRIVGLGLVCISLIVLYVSYVSGRKDVAYASQINIKHICLGLLLILIDVSYNLYIGDEFRSLDYGMLGAGSVIILMNSGLLRFLKLEEEMISFSSYFIFIVMLSYSFLFSGLPFILNSTENVFFDFVTGISVKVSAFFLRFINPNVSATWNSINFEGYKVNIGYPCSGVESITIFLSAVVAYFIAINEKSIKKMGLYAIIGIIALFFMNILRIMAIILAGYYLGPEEMLFVHYHLGWVIFILGMAVFWYLVFR